MPVDPRTVNRGVPASNQTAGIKVGNVADLQRTPLEGFETQAQEGTESLTPGEHDAKRGVETVETQREGIEVEANTNTSTGNQGEDMNSLTVDQLKERLASQDKPVSGTKDELIARLNE